MNGNSFARLVGHLDHAVHALEKRTGAWIVHIPHFAVKSVDSN